MIRTAKQLKDKVKKACPAGIVKLRKIKDDSGLEEM